MCQMSKQLHIFISFFFGYMIKVQFIFITSRFGSVAMFTPHSRTPLGAAYAFLIRDTLGKGFELKTRNKHCISLTHCAEWLEPRLQGFNGTVRPPSFLISLPSRLLLISRLHMPRTVTLLFIRRNVFTWNPAGGLTEYWRVERCTSATRFLRGSPWVPVRQVESCERRWHY